jgi:hypothetical protein
VFRWEKSLNLKIFKCRSRRVLKLNEHRDRVITSNGIPQQDTDFEIENVLGVRLGESGLAKNEQQPAARRQQSGGTRSHVAPPKVEISAARF